MTSHKIQAWFFATLRSITITLDSQQTFMPAKKSQAALIMV